MPVVTVLNDETRVSEVLKALEDHGLVVVNHLSRPGGREFANKVEQALGPRSDEELLVLHELRLVVDGEPWWTNVLVLPPGHVFQHEKTLALASRALNASIASGLKASFRYAER